MVLPLLDVGKLGVDAEKDELLSVPGWLCIWDTGCWS